MKSVVGRSVVEQASRTLARLELALEERQAALGRVAEYTSEVDVFLASGEDRRSEACSAGGASGPSRALDQRDALPGAVWEWSGVAPSVEGIGLAQEALIHAAKDPRRAASCAAAFTRDSELFAYGAMHVMSLYAERVDAEFREFMGELFEGAFRPAPVKKAR